MLSIQRSGNIIILNLLMNMNLVNFLPINSQLSPTFSLRGMNENYGVGNHLLEQKRI